MNLKKVSIKNCTCYYFDDIIKLEDFDIDNILIDEKSCENVLIFNISYKAFIGSKPLCIRFYKTNGYIRIYDGTRDLTLALKNIMLLLTIIYLTSLKSGITYIFSHNFGKIIEFACYNAH